MGTDIHSIARVRVGRDGYWATVAGRVAGDVRNYDTFAILADVRNGVGFAGVVTGEPWPVMATLRGLPADLRTNKEKTATNCPCCLGENSLWLGDHSHSYVSLSEIKAMIQNLDARGGQTKHGVVTLETFNAWKERGEAPEAWSGMVTGPSVLVFNQSEWDPGIVTMPGKEIYIQMEWKVDWKEAAHSFVKIAEALEVIRSERGLLDADVQFVFGFDS